MGPAISEATGQAPRFSCIYSAPASCLLKSALDFSLGEPISAVN